jgi:hypothetical protein
VQVSRTGYSSHTVAEGMKRSARQDEMAKMCGVIQVSWSMQKTWGKAGQRFKPDI